MVLGAAAGFTGLNQLVILSVLFNASSDASLMLLLIVLVVPMIHWFIYSYVLFSRNAVWLSGKRSWLLGRQSCCWSKWSFALSFSWCSLCCLSCAFVLSWTLSFLAFYSMIKWFRETSTIEAPQKVLKKLKFHYDYFVNIFCPTITKNDRKRWALYIIHCILTTGNFFPSAITSCSHIPTCTKLGTIFVVRLNMTQKLLDVLTFTKCILWKID